MSQAIEAVSPSPGPAAAGPIQADWELDYYSRPILEPDGKKRWELLICSSPLAGTAGSLATAFRWALNCPAASVNSAWLRQSLEEALAAAAEQGFAAPRRLRCWRGSMRTMVQRAAEPLGLEVVPSRRCYTLVEWLQQREASVYPAEEGYMAGPLAPPPQPIQPLAVPLPEAARGDSWSWASLPLGALREASDWDSSFLGLVPLPPDLDDAVMVSGLRLFSASRSLAIAGWLAGLEPVAAAGVPAGLLERRYGVALERLDGTVPEPVQAVRNAGEPGHLPPDAAGWLAAAAARHTSGDTARMAQRLLDDFRRGQLGAIALELPPAGRITARSAAPRR